MEAYEEYLEHFSHDKVTNTTRCLFCDLILKGYKKFNLKRHYDTCSKKQSDKTPFEGSIARQIHSIRVNLTTREIVESCLKIVTFSGKPFADLNSDGFRRLFEPYGNALRACGLSITHRNIHGYIKATADSIRGKIAAELNGEYFCLMVDIATKNKRSILGMNIQCVINDEIVIRTISMGQLTERHTSDNICDNIIKDIFPMYNFEPEQVYSFCADNAYSMKKTGELIDEEAEAGVPSEGPAFGEMAGWRFIEEEDYEDAVLNMARDCEFYADLISNVAQKYAQRNKDIHIKSTNTIGCANHTLHLGVEKGITLTPSVSTLISTSRDLAKKLRTPTIFERIKAAGYRLPEIDVPTRWNSKYTMLVRLYELKPFVEELCKEDKKYEFKKWKELKTTIDILHIPYVPSIKLQAVQCTLTDMWALWNLLLLQLDKNTGALAKNILVCLKEREHVVKNPTMFAALFLDPRYKAILNPAEQQLAICELVNLHNKMEKKRNQNKRHEPQIDELELMLMAAEVNEENVVDEDEIDRGHSVLQREFDLFKRMKRVDKDTSVLAFWKENKVKFPQMYQLARVLFSVSNGQTSVERGFSGLNFVYDVRRCNLKADVLNDILMIRLNKDVYNNLEDSDWDKILNNQLQEGVQAPK